MIFSVLSIRKVGAHVLGFSTMADLEQDLKELGVEGISAVGKALSSRAEDYVNDARLEQGWAIMTMKYAETHFKLLQSYDASSLKLTAHDDEIYAKFMGKFSNLRIDILTPDDLKSDAAKTAWRAFCNQFDGKVEDFNFGTLLRLDVTKEYTEENTIVVPRVQFLAIEIARNRHNMNTMHHNTS